MDTIVALSRVRKGRSELEIVYSKRFSSGSLIVHEDVMQDALYDVDIGTYILWTWTDSICHGCQMPAGFETNLIGLYTVYQREDNNRLDYKWGISNHDPAPTKVVRWPPK